MTDIRADDRTPLDDEDRLPWLEAVDEEGDSAGPSALKLIVAVLIGLVAIGGIVGGLFWLGNRDATASRDAELIRSPEGDYKVRPADPGGMNVQGEGDTAFAASEGADPNGTINANALPEAPVVETTRPQAPAPAPKSAPAPAPAPAAAGSTIQLGAFSSQASANNAWKALSSRFAYLAPLNHSIMPTASGGRTLYRLRAWGGDAKGICNRLRVAGEACTLVD